MRRLSSYVLAAGLALMSSSASALMIVPLCQDGDMLIYDTSQLTGGLTLGIGDVARNRDGVILASCASRTQLVVTEAGDDFSTVDVVNEINRAVASTETYSFEDLADRFESWNSTSEIKPISAELCGCLTKEY